MFEYFLYILAQDPSEITDILNEIVSAANEIGFEVVSGIWSLKGKYETLIRKKLKKMQTQRGFSFKDSSGQKLDYPPVIVEKNKIWEASFTRKEFQSYRKVDLPSNVTIRTIEEELIGYGNGFRASHSIEQGIKLIQYANATKKPVLYIPYEPSCQNLVDGPLQFIQNKIIVVDWSKIFRDYTDYRIIDSKNSVKKILKDLYEI